MKSFSDVLKAHEAKSQVYCPMCTHTVEAMVTFAGKQAKVTPGQKCAHCGSSIDAGFVPLRSGCVIRLQLCILVAEEKFVIEAK